MRLFIAINFDNDTKDRITEVQDRLRAKGRGRFSSRDNLHLTLAFLGEVGEERVPELKDIIGGIDVPAMRLRFSHVGCFRKDSELWWIGIEENRALSAVQRELCEKLREADFWFDSKKFRPHITLAREMRVGRIGQNELLPEEFSCTADQIDLMLSERVGGKLRYSRL